MMSIDGFRPLLISAFVPCVRLLVEKLYDGVKHR